MNHHNSPPTSVDSLENCLSAPPQRVIDVLGRIEGDILILGAGGKMGPSLARMAKRASDLAGSKRKVIAVSRFSDHRAGSRLQQAGVETISSDLLQPGALEALPDAANVLIMTGFKFGGSNNPAHMWGVNCWLPPRICERFPHSRLVAFSSGNIYGPVPVSGQGSLESDDLNPVGEYAMATLGRERLLEFASRRFQTPLATLRLNYATELRYGVLVDMAEDVMHEREIDVTNGYVNVIWLTDANAMTLQAFAAAECPPAVVNIAGSKILRVRDVCQQFAEYFNKPLKIVGQEADAALLSNGAKGRALFGEPEFSAECMIEWTAQWVASGGESLNKPTHFLVTDGKY